MGVALSPDNGSAVRQEREKGGDTVTRGKQVSEGHRVGEYPIIVRVFHDRKGLNFFRWLWACADLFQRVRVGTFFKCELGRCNVTHSFYAGGDDWVADMLRHGLCPICGNPTVEKYNF